MLGAVAKLLYRGTRAAARVAGKTDAPSIAGQAWKWSRGESVVASALRGSAKGAAVGGALWAGTGNSDWMALMMGAGAWRGGAKNIMARSGRKAAFGWFNPNRMTRNMAVGTAAGVYMDDPNMAAYSTVALPLAGMFAKGMFNPSGMGTWLKGSAQMLYAPQRAAQTLGGLSGAQVWSAPWLGGMIGGAGYAGFKLKTGWGKPDRNPITSGTYPGGVMELGPGRARGIPNGHLSTDGLTLALHKNARKTRHM